MANIFISYRRDDSMAVTGRIFDRLKSHFGSESVFIDIDGIPLGVDFRQYLNDAVSKCNVLLAIIGENWLQTDQNGKRRLDDPADFVRVEIEAALARNIPVIPVLVSRMPMPSVDQLPPTLAKLVYRNATHVDPGTDFELHIQRLIQGLDSPFRKTNSDTSKADIGNDDLDKSSPGKVKRPNKQLEDIKLKETPEKKSQSTNAPIITSAKITGKAGRTAEAEEDVEAITGSRRSAEDYPHPSKRDEKEGLQYYINKFNDLMTFKKSLIAILFVAMGVTGFIFLINNPPKYDPDSISKPGKENTLKNQKDRNTGGGPLSDHIRIKISQVIPNQYIYGTVEGLKAETYKDYKVLIYVLTDQWYIHPYETGAEGRTFASINDDGTWKIQTVQRKRQASRLASLLTKRTTNAPPQVSAGSDPDKSLVTQINPVAYDIINAPEGI